jgi:hypothetical protein
MKGRHPAYIPICTRVCPRSKRTLHHGRDRDCGLDICTPTQKGDHATLLIDGNNWVNIWLELPQADTYKAEHPDVLSKPFQKHLDHARGEIKIFLNHAVKAGWKVIHVFFDLAKVQDCEREKWWDSKKAELSRGGGPAFAGEIVCVCACCMHVCLLAHVHDCDTTLVVPHLT